MDGIDSDSKRWSFFLVTAAFAFGGVVGHLMMSDGPTRVVQGIAASGPVCMQARALDVVEADGLCVVGTGTTSVVVHYCRVSP